MITLIIMGGLLVLILVLVITWIGGYNKLKTRQNQIHNAESSLDALFIKRHDLIPNLITVVKENAQYEKGVLEKLTELRSDKNDTEKYMEDSELSASVKNLMVQVENYPVLKANEQFTKLSYRWSEVEEQISAGRRYLSASITDYNDGVTTFPTNIIASLSNFHVYQWERATEEQRQKIDAKQHFNN